MCEQIEEKKLREKLKFLDLDEGIRIEGASEAKKVFINKNACENYVVQVVDSADTASNSNQNIKYFYSVAEVCKFVKSIFDENFSISQY
ncbi:MAG TPA: hypothetical protein VEH06_03090 [Candidatus Bathyarchaeia archaeon]|nr:hypothetical protein [Candidatus Bathyarchaeia archaeon]